MSAKAAVFSPDGNPLAEGLADAFVVSIAQGGTFVNGVLNPFGTLVNREISEGLQVILDLTDSTGLTFDSTAFPSSIDFAAFDIAKGFTSTGPGGILFNIDTFEEIEPNKASVELSTGFHVSWPTDTNGYVLEESETVAGSWIRHKDKPLVVEGLNIVPMDQQSRTKFYRLNRAN